jgi:hypothetical protein
MADSETRSSGDRSLYIILILEKSEDWNKYYHEITNLFLLYQTTGYILIKKHPE